MIKLTRWEAFKKVIKPHNLIVIIILLIANSLAWFIYATEVENEMSAHVRSWNVIFEAGESEVTNYVNIEVDSMYPGMIEGVYEIKAYNRSEVAASVKYVIHEANIIGDIYQTVEGKKESGLEVLTNDLTSEQLSNKIANEYPFKIIISLSKTEMVSGNDDSVFQIKVSWPFESGDDSSDTYWGTKAASYKKDYPDKPSITLKIKISIIQKN